MLYPKIEGPYRRHTEGPNRNKIIHGDWTRPEFDILANADWVWTEKIDGTNIRIIWDGHRVEIGGRTESAQIPADLIKVLQATFPEELMEQQFKDTAVTLFGEGFGGKIQAGGKYSALAQFALFDVRIGDWWLLPDKIIEVADQLAVPRAPVVFEGSVYEAITRVAAGQVKSAWGDFLAEGLVGRAPLGLRARDGGRLVMKVKIKDFM